MNKHLAGKWRSRAVPPKPAHAALLIHESRGHPARASRRVFCRRRSSHRRARPRRSQSGRRGRATGDQSRRRFDPRLREAATCGDDVAGGPRVRILLLHSPGTSSRGLPLHIAEPSAHTIIPSSSRKMAQNRDFRAVSRRTRFLLAREARPVAASNSPILGANARTLACPGKREDGIGRCRFLTWVNNLSRERQVGGVYGIVLVQAVHLLRQRNPTPRHAQHDRLRFTRDIGLG
jgi:hypothetical protein